MGGERVAKEELGMGYSNGKGGWISLPVFNRKAEGRVITDVLLLPLLKYSKSTASTSCVTSYQFCDCSCVGVYVRSVGAAASQVVRSLYRTC